MSTHHQAAIIAMLAVIVVAYFAVRRWRQSRETFSLATPATSAAREAAGELFGSIKSMVSLGRSYCGENLPQASNVARLTSALEAALAALGGAPPTYVNYLAIYRGLASSDRALLAAADEYAAASKRCTDSGKANTLAAMSTQLRRLVANVHRLGGALDVE